MRWIDRHFTYAVFERGGTYDGWPYDAIHANDVCRDCDREFGYDVQIEFDEGGPVRHRVCPVTSGAVDGELMCGHDPECDDDRCVSACNATGAITNNSTAVQPKE